MGRRGAEAVRGWSELALVFAAGLLLAWLASVTPRPLPADAPVDRFSAGRAMLDIAQLARVPHPLGSVQDDAVRGDLLGRLRALQLSPQVGVFDHVRSWDEPKDVRTYRVSDIVARVAGSDARLPAVLVMSHYDSVPRSPGAADDMAGVASALEMARLLRLHPPRRDVLLAFTDGEEAGLVGAGALLTDRAFVRSIGAVVNMDVRGGGGRGLMFQTGRSAGGLQRLYAAHGLHPAGNSLAAYLYGILPNDTDFTVALAHGLTGLNYAFIGRPQFYHTPAAVPQAVEAGAVQSLGEQAWIVVRSLADGGGLPASEPDLTWFDLFGRSVVIYPPGFGWLPLLASAALFLLAGWRQRAGSQVQAADVSVGALQSMGATLLAAVGLYAYGRLALHGYYASLGRAPQTEAVIAAVCVGSALLVFRASAPASRPLGRWSGALLLAWFIAALLQAAAPRTAFLAEWPALLAALALCGVTFGGRAARVGALACAALALGFLLEIEHMLVLGVGLTLPAAGVAIMPWAIAGLVPVLQPSGAGGPLLRDGRRSTFPTSRGSSTGV